MSALFCPFLCFRSYPEKLEVYTPTFYKIRVLGHVGEGTEVGLGPESELLGLLLGHDETGGGAVSKVR